jgi:hypothetical protein
LRSSNYSGQQHNDDCDRFHSRLPAERSEKSTPWFICPYSRQTGSYPETGLGEIDG